MIGEAWMIGSTERLTGNMKSPPEVSWRKWGWTVEGLLSPGLMLRLFRALSHLAFTATLKGVYYSKVILESEKAMAPHSSTRAWKIPWMEEPGGPQSMGSLRVGLDSVTSLWLFTFMHWRRKCQPTPVFLPGESQGWGSLMGCHLWGHTESDTTEAT